MQISQLYDYAPHSISADGDWLSASVQYLVDDCNNEQEALQYAFEKIPHELQYTDGKDALLLQNIEIDDRKSEDSWSVTANYSAPEQSSFIIGGTGQSDSESTMSFDCGAGTKHVTHAYAETRYPATAPTAGYAVNWNGKYGNDMQISGVDIPTAQMRETYTKVIPVSKLTTRYKRIVADLVGRVNNSDFKGWEKGEVQFLGMSYSAPDKRANKVVVTYNFAISPNERNVVIAGQTVSKEGFDYAWALSEQVVSGGVTSVSTGVVYVDKVCQYGDFSQLGV